MDVYTNRMSHELKSELHEVNLKKYLNVTATCRRPIILIRKPSGQNWGIYPFTTFIAIAEINTHRQTAREIQSVTPPQISRSSVAVPKQNASRAFGCSQNSSKQQIFYPKKCESIFFDVFSHEWQRWEENSLKKKNKKKILTRNRESSHLFSRKIWQHPTVYIELFLSATDWQSSSLFFFWHLKRPKDSAFFAVIMSNYRRKIPT